MLHEGYLKSYLFGNDITLFFLGSGLPVIKKKIEAIYTQFVK